MTEAQETFVAGMFRIFSGRRIVVRQYPAEAVHVVVGCLLQQGFTLFGDLETTLREEGSSWTATATRIGKHTGLLRGLANTLIDETPLMLLPLLKRDIPPTLVVTAARWMPDGTCGVLIMPYVSFELLRGALDGDERLAAPRLNAAIGAAIDMFQAAGTFVDDHWGVGNVEKDCPVLPKRVRALTNWR